MLPNQRLLTEHSRLIADLQRFAARLYGQRRAQSGNIAISPYSVAVALSLLAAGTSGPTHKSIEYAFGFGGADDAVPQGMALLAQMLRPASPDHGVSAYNLETANALWLQRGWSLPEPFRSLAELYYTGLVRHVDFQADPANAAAIMNQWVADRTNDKIQNLVPTPPPITRLCLTNALWMKSAWLQPFPRSATRLGIFSSPHGKIDAPLMHQLAHSRCAAIDGGTIAMLKLHGDVDLVVVVPETADGLAALEDKLVAGALSEWIIATSNQRADWIFPKLSLKQSASIDLTRNLVDIGLHLGGPADYAGMAISPPDDVQDISLAAIVHKVFVAIDEDGLEAAAATAVLFANEMGPPGEIVPVHCDRPFLWAIRHELTRTVLFIGRITDPSMGL